MKNKKLLHKLPMLRHSSFVIRQFVIGSILTLHFALWTLNSNAQCTNGLIYGQGATEIMAYDPSTGTTVSTGIPKTGEGLTYGPNLNAASPSPTFYAVEGCCYSYWNGAAWISTGHSVGSSAGNIGTGGGFIYKLDWGAGGIYKYDGTGAATLVTTVPEITLGSGMADISVDACGNFYLLKFSTPQWLKVYNPSGVVIGTYTITGLPTFSLSALGLSIVGSTVYAHIGSPYVGTITGSNIDFVPGTFAPSGIDDYASCPSPCFVPLPIQLLTFTGNCTENNSVHVAWSTATETNNDYFTVERSTAPDPSKGGGLNWEAAGTVKGAGNSSTVRSYAFIDNQVLPFGEDLGGVVYYRLKQTDYDGKSEIFNDKQIAVDVTECAVKVFPNPAGNTLNIPYAAEQDGEVTLQVYDVIGKLVKEKSVTATKGNNKFTLDLTTVAQGMYVLSVKNGAKELNQKFVKGN